MKFFPFPSKREKIIHRTCLKAIYTCYLLQVQNKDITKNEVWTIFSGFRICCNITRKKMLTRWNSDEHLSFYLRLVWKEMIYLRNIIRARLFMEGSNLGVNRGTRWKRNSHLNHTIFLGRVVNNMLGSRGRNPRLKPRSRWDFSLQ